MVVFQESKDEPAEEGMEGSKDQWFLVSGSVTISPTGEVSYTVPHHCDIAGHHGASLQSVAWHNHQHRKGHGDRAATSRRRHLGLWAARGEEVSQECCM